MENKFRGSAPPEPRGYVWRLSPVINLRFIQLIRKFSDLDNESDEAYAIQDEILSLPGFPHPFDLEKDILKRVIVKDIRSR